MGGPAAEAVKSYARALGFDLVGITTADPFPEDEARLRRWVEGGLHGAMACMAAHAPRAARPAQVAAGARSAVVNTMLITRAGHGSFLGAVLTDLDLPPRPRGPRLVRRCRMDPRAVPALAAALDDPDPIVRGHAAWALGRIGGPGARRALEARRAAEIDDRVREEVAQAVAGMSSGDEPDQARVSG